MLKAEGFGAVLEVEMLKKCTPLWREAHFKVKSVKNCRFGALLEVEMFKMHAVVVRSTFQSQNVKSATTLLKVQMWFYVRDSVPCQK